MSSHHSRSSVLSRWVIVLALVLGVFVSATRVASVASQTPEARMPVVHDMVWPQGVELLAAQVFTLPEGEVQWRVSSLEADDEPGQVTETGRGVVIAVNGTVLLEVNEDEFVQLEAGSAFNLSEGDEITATSEGDDPVQYLVIELLRHAEDNTTDESNLVGPVQVEEGGYAMVLLNLPADMTSDMAAEQVIDGALRPGVSIAYTDDGIPERLEDDEEYHRFIVALYPPEVLSTPEPVTETPPAATEEPATTQAPIRTSEPTATATSAPTATATSQPTVPAPTATQAPQPTATTPPPAPTATTEPQPTEPPTPSPTEDSFSVPTPVPPVIPTPAPPVIPPIPTIPPVTGG